VKKCSSRSRKGPLGFSSINFLVEKRTIVSLDGFSLIQVFFPEFMFAAPWSLGGGGNGDRRFPAAPGGGARSMHALGFTMPPPDKPAAESMHFQLLTCFSHISKLFHLPEAEQ
jgi:hypothetical protein